MSQGEWVCLACGAMNERGTSCEACGVMRGNQAAPTGREVCLDCREAKLGILKVDGVSLCSACRLERARVGASSAEDACADTACPRAGQAHTVGDHIREFREIVARAAWGERFGSKRPEGVKL